MQGIRPALGTALLIVCLPGAGLRAARAQEAAAQDRAARIRALEQRTWEVRAARTDVPIRIDGRLDDAGWRLAEPVVEFYQRERNEGLPASERTEVRVVYDEQNLYVGFRCYDSEPERVRARAIFRDESAGADDLVAIMIDAYHGHRGAIQFVSNANGVIYELLQTGETEGTRNANFDTVWVARGARTPDGYEVEFAIPFKSLRFDPPKPGEEAVFGIGFKRNIPRKNEEVVWPFVSNDSSWYRPAELGHLRGLVGIEPGRNLQVRPYALAGALRDAGRALDGRREAGLDVKWGVTTGLTADFTVNTDFAQEEADVQQINFTRFSLFFPEKRQFFLEGQQAFQFGIPREAELVFTRRIGLSPRGEVVPIAAGARLSGRQGATTIGAMSIRTGEAAGLPAQTFSVLRVRRDLFTRSSVGAVLTDVQGGGTFNRVVGADASFLFQRVWTAEGFVARQQTSGGTPGGHAGYGRFAYESDLFDAEASYLDIGEGFRPGVGFVRRPDVRRYDAGVTYSPRPAAGLVRQYRFSSGISYTTDQRGRLETRARELEAAVEFESGDTLSAEYQHNFEFLPEPFAVQGVPVLPGTYRWSDVRVELETFRRRHRRIDVSYAAGGFWDGTRETLTIEPSYRVSTQLGLSGAYEINWVDLPRGQFTTHLVSARVQLAFRNDVALLSLLQYNHESREFSTNIRFRWIPRPGSDFFIVYNGLDERGVGGRSRSLVVKLAYLFQL
ncbi:MAG TPA: DUF5916 domain-containing protein [Vicinamibacterales bacterium]|nr:DUF5916 domain-containing protein [Vicinamibacterales bacterium]